MPKENDGYNNGYAAETNFTEVIASTAIKTLFTLVVAGALIAAFLLRLFPAKASVFYEDIGNTYRAYEYTLLAQKSAKGSEIFSLKLKRFRLSAEIMDSNGGFYDEVTSAAADFLSDEQCVSRAANIDAAKAEMPQLSLRPNAYSYVDYVNAKCAKAAFLSGKNPYYYMGEFLSFEVRTAKMGGEKDDLIFFNQINAVFGAGGRPKTDTEFIQKLIAVKDSSVIAGETPTLYEMYRLLAVSRLLNNLSECGAITSVDARINGKEAQTYYYQCLNLYIISGGQA